MVTIASSASGSTQFQGEIVYDSTKGDQYYGKFKATRLDLGQTPTGTYTVYVTVASHLTKSLGSMLITTAIDNTVPGDPQGLIAGDITGDGNTSVVNNQLDINDYNVLISCSIYSKDNHATCDLDKKFLGLSDLEDNGDANGLPLVNEFDYNLFLREFASGKTTGDNPPGTTQASADQTVDATVISAADAALTGAVTPTVTATTGRQ